MKHIFFLFTALLCSMTAAFAQTEFELDPSQSMCITGKGPGQDGAINPYAGQDSYAIVENYGDSAFSIRVESEQQIIEILTVPEGEQKQVTLLKGYVLYFDTDAKTNARVKFEKMIQ